VIGFMRRLVNGLPKFKEFFGYVNSEIFEEDSVSYFWQALMSDHWACRVSKCLNPNARVFAFVHHNGQWLHLFLFLCTSPNAIVTSRR
jgi:hypothetical protein